MKVRIISGVVGIAVALIAIALFNTLWLEAFAVIICLLAMYEIWSEFKENNSYATLILLCLMGILESIN